jgi:hypothetical protein
MRTRFFFELLQKELRKKPTMGYCKSLTTEARNAPKSQSRVASANTSSAETAFSLSL